MKWLRNGHGRRRSAPICKRIANIGASEERQPVDVGTDRIEHSKVEVPAGMAVTSVDQDDKLASEPRVDLLRPNALTTSRNLSRQNIARASSWQTTGPPLAAAHAPHSVLMCSRRASSGTA
jgi:hypothetical protein